jgi:hypothetical protein
MESAVSIDFIAEVLVIGDNNPVFVKRLLDNVVIIHTPWLHRIQRTHRDCAFATMRPLPAQCTHQREISSSSAAKGMKSVSFRALAAKRKQARMSSSVRPFYSSKIAFPVAPWARRFNIKSTVKLVPRITGFPTMTSGFRLMRPRP